MKKYAVAYINFFDNELKMSIQEAENEVNACKKHLWNKVEQQSWIDELPNDLEELQNAMFDMESQINAIEI